jgi:CO/xanthine dehydrogenase Mo-binding subunit
MTSTGFYRPAARPYDATTGQGRPYATNSYTAHVAEVEVLADTGEVRVLRVTAVHDIGRVIFPDGVRGQIEGGVVQGAGLALWEELKTGAGYVQNPGFTDYAIPGIADAPEVRWSVVEQPWRGGPFGAKGIGEPSLIGVPAAIANAVSDAIGVPVRELPLTPERVRRMLVASS